MWYHQCHHESFHPTLNQQALTPYANPGAVVNGTHIHAVINDTYNSITSQRQPSELFHLFFTASGAANSAIQRAGGVPPQWMLRLGHHRLAAGLWLRQHEAVQILHIHELVCPGAIPPCLQQGDASLESIISPFVRIPTLEHRNMSVSQHNTHQVIRRALRRPQHV